MFPWFVSLKIVHPDWIGCMQVFFRQSLSDGIYPIPDQIGDNNFG